MVLVDNVRLYMCRRDQIATKTVLFSYVYTYIWVCSVQFIYFMLFFFLFFIIIVMIIIIIVISISCDGSIREENDETMIKSRRKITTHCVWNLSGVHICIYSEQYVSVLCRLYCCIQWICLVEKVYQDMCVNLIIEIWGKDLTVLSVIFQSCVECSSLSVSMSFFYIYVSFFVYI